jgi:hypothetical protein
MPVGITELKVNIIQPSGIDVPFQGVQVQVQHA